jgi:hypothetical protein
MSSLSDVSLVCAWAVSFLSQSLASSTSHAAASFQPSLPAFYAISSAGVLGAILVHASAVVPDLSRASDAAQCYDYGKPPGNARFVHQLSSSCTRSHLALPLSPHRAFPYSGWLLLVRHKSSTHLRARSHSRWRKEDKGERKENKRHSMAAVACPIHKLYSRLRASGLTGCYPILGNQLTEHKCEKCMRSRADAQGLKSMASTPN